MNRLKKLLVCSNMHRLTAEPYMSMTLFVFAFNALTIPQLVQHKVCLNMYNATICRQLGQHISFQNEVQQNAAKWMSVLPLTALVPALFMIFIIGPLTDVIGKKVFMVLPPSIYLVQSIIFIVLCLIKRPFSPGLFLVPACITGIFGDNAGATLLSVAYIADITTPEERTVRLAFMESFMFVGTLVSALSTGAIVSRFGFVWGFIVSSIISAINLTYTIFLLPSEDTLRPNTECSVAQSTDRSALNNKYGSFVDHLDQDEGEQRPSKRGWRETLVLVRKEVHPRACISRLKNVLCKENRRNMIAALLVLLAISLIANMGEIYMGVLFLSHRPFNLSSIQIGYLAATQYSICALGVVVIPYICQGIFKMKDADLLIIGFSTQMVFFVTLGFSVSVLMLYLVQILNLGVPVHLPVIRSMVTKLVDADQHGTALTMVEAVDIASSLLTSFISNEIYAATVKVFSGFAICLLGIYAAVGLVGAVILRVRSKELKSEDCLSEERVILGPGKCSTEE